MLCYLVGRSYLVHSKLATVLSFLDVQTKIKEIEDETAVQLYRRDCKTLVASMSRCPGRAAIISIFYEINFKTISVFSWKCPSSSLHFVY